MRPSDLGFLSALVLAILISASSRPRTGASLFADELFVDVTDARGIRFVNVNGASGKRRLVETMVAGAAWLDYDRDGFLDLYLVQGHDRPGESPESTRGAAGPGNVLYRSVGGTRFEDVSAKAGVDDRGYGMGVAVGDYDNDGYPDLYVTNYGRNILYHNQRDGTFRDVTRKARVGGQTAKDGKPIWSSSATWADFDGDGRLDLYVANYLAYDTRRDGACQTPLPGTNRRVPAYCHPNRFAGVADTLYRNLGDGVFEDVSKKSGVARLFGPANAKGLGVVASDFDNDGDADIFVANDTVSNVLWRNLGGFRFEEVGLETGFALSGDGAPEAGMGIDRADIDGDGFLDYFVTNFSRETNTLYKNEQGFLVDATVQSRLARAGYLPLGFGARFIDYDLDGDLDLYVVNGHILDNCEELHPGEKISFAQPDQLFENDGRGRFQEVSSKAGKWFRRALVGRTVVEGDYDNDGDGDLLITNVRGQAVLLENRHGTDGNWIGLDPRSPRVIHGARIELETPDGKRIHEVQRDGSYLGSHDVRVRFGLGAGVENVVAKIRWPGKPGPPQVLKGLAVGKYNVVR